MTWLLNCWNYSIWLKEKNTNEHDACVVQQLPSKSINRPWRNTAGCWYSVLICDTVGLYPLGLTTQLEQRVWAMSHSSSHPMCSLSGIKIQQCVQALGVESPWPSLTITTLSGLHEWESLSAKSSLGLNKTVSSTARKTWQLLKSVWLKYPSTTRLWESGGSAFFLL